MSSTDQLGTNVPPIRIDSSMVSTMAGQLTANTAQPIPHPLMGHLMQHQHQPLHPAIHQVQRHPHIMPATAQQQRAAAAQAAPTPTPSSTQSTETSTKSSTNSHTTRSSSAAASHAHDDHDDHDDSEVEESEDEGSDAPSNNNNQSTKGGSSCHQCKSRRNYNALTYCTATLDAKSKKCRKKFCGHCLRKFYKENPSLIPSKSSWICPSCRKICCCAACRRRKQRESGSAGADEGDMKKRAKVSNAYVPPANHDQSNQSYDTNNTSTDQSTNSSSAPASSQPTADDAASMSDEEDNSLGHVPQQVSRDVFNEVLASHISILSEETLASHGDTQFSLLYKAAKQGKLRRRIRDILQQSDLTPEKRVELIAISLVNAV